MHVNFQSVAGIYALHEISCSVLLRWVSTVHVIFKKYLHHELKINLSQTNESFEKQRNRWRRICRSLRPNNYTYILSREQKNVVLTPQAKSHFDRLLRVSNPGFCLLKICCNDDSLHQHTSQLSYFEQTAAVRQHFKLHFSRRQHCLGEQIRWALNSSSNNHHMTYPCSSLVVL